jgi:hypothetical protein
MEAFNQKPIAAAITTANDVSNGYVLAKRAQDIDLEELNVDQSTMAFKALMRNLVIPAVDAVWPTSRILLDKFGGIAGGAQFAHCLFAEDIYNHSRADFDALGKSSDGDVTLKLIWDLAHDRLKKYGVVFRNGWVEGTRSDHIKG